MVKCLIYCTKSKDYHLDCEIVNGKKKWFCWNKKSHHYPFKYVKEELGEDYKETFNGHIVAQFDCENIIEFDTNGKRLGYAINLKPIIEKSCLSLEEMKKYIGNKKGYAIHINNLEIFDEPKELAKHTLDNKSDFYIKKWIKKFDSFKGSALTKAPQNMCNVYDVQGNHYILISIRPEWVEKILNGEKTIEVRKSIVNKLKELI